MYVCLLCCGNIPVNCFVHCETSLLRPAHFMFTLGWKRLCQNMKDHSFHQINIFNLLSEDASLLFSWFCISSCFFPPQETSLESMILFFFKQYICIMTALARQPNNECCARRESVSTPIVIFFPFENYRHLKKSQFSVGTIYFYSSVLQTAVILFQE